MEWAAGKWVPRAIFHSNAMWIARKVFTWKVFCVCVRTSSKRVANFAPSCHGWPWHFIGVAKFRTLFSLFFKFFQNFVLVDSCKNFGKTHSNLRGCRHCSWRDNWAKNWTKKKRMKNTKASRVEINNNKSENLIITVN